MPKEGIPIKKEKVQEIILKEVDNRNIVLSQQETELIDRIVKSFPNFPNASRLSKWCISKVDEEIKKYPDALEDIAEIRSRVGKEIRYIIHENSFKEITEVINKENPKRISPYWLTNRFPAFSQSISLGYQKNDGSVDWDFIADKLNIKDRFSVREMKEWGGDRDKIVSGLVKVLEDKKPAIFNPTWIVQNAEDIHTQIRYSFKEKEDLREKGKPNWEEFRSYLPNEWKERFFVKQIRKNVSLLSILDKIKNKIVEEKIKTISPKWIFSNFRADYKLLQRKILPRDEKNNTRWDTLIDLLPKDLVKWEKKTLLREKIPDNVYNDPEETDVIINKFKDDLYTFLVINNKEIDKPKRDKITKELIILAQKGNIDALERLTDYLYFTVENWIESIPEFKLSKYAQNDIRDIIKRCIYLFKPEVKNNFYTYLFRSIQFGLLVIKKRMNNSGTDDKKPENNPWNW